MEQTYIQLTLYKVQIEYNYDSSISPKATLILNLKTAVLYSQHIIIKSLTL